MKIESCVFLLGESDAAGLELFDVALASCFYVGS